MLDLNQHFENFDVQILLLNCLNHTYCVILLCKYDLMIIGYGINLVHTDAPSLYLFKKTIMPIM